jgi:Transposase, Mutator family
MATQLGASFRSAFPAAVRRIIYTTNAIEALNAKLRRAVRMRGHFPTDDAATKLLFLVLRQAAGEWKRPPREWFGAKTQFAIMFDERFVQASWQPVSNTRFLTLPRSPEPTQVDSRRNSPKPKP